MSSKNKTTDTKKAETPALLPKLRFSEFQSAGDWATVKLGAVATICTEKVGSNICVPMSITSGVGLVSQEEKFGRVIAGDSYKNYFLLKPNEFAYNKSATKEFPEGFLTLYSGAALAAVPNSIFTCFRINGASPDIRFLNYQFLDNLHGRWLRKFIQVGARAHGSLSINDDDLMTLPVPIPKGSTSVAEQKKIAECLSSADELVATQARKVGALKAHKNGLMQQLFPREGETQPRLRFPEFQNAGEWAKTTIGDLNPFVTSGSRGWAPFYAEQGELFVRITNLRRDSIYLDLTDSKFVQLPPGANEGVRTQLKEHDVLISITADIGIIGYVDESVPSPAYINQHIALVRFDARQLCGEFVAYFLAAEKSQRLFRASTDTGTKAGMSLIGIQKIELMLPGLPEQQRIASCLSSVDALIIAETQKLETLNTYKKGLMQQLFPSPKELDA
ncbi:restriction endonuclease subunit S [Achromobacter aegrifaciens]